MDRREMLKGAAAITAGGMLPAGFAYGEHTHSLDTRWSDKGRGVPEPKPYDAIAVLEAMRERKIGYRLWQNHGLVYAALIDEENYWKCYHTELPDFPSAVRWLHRQAAAVDAEFAKAWPVPE